MITDTLRVCGGSRLTPEARAELEDFARWLRLPKPRPEFHGWRASLAQRDDRDDRQLPGVPFSVEQSPTAWLHEVERIGDETRVVPGQEVK